MWLKSLVTIILFYLLAVLQSSFFIHFNIMGTNPNLVLILFFTIVFFKKDISYYEIMFWAVVAGFLLDVFSYSYFGVSIVLLSIAGISVKKIILSLREREDKYPIGYFVFIFLFFNIFYDVFSGLFFFFFDPAHIIFSFNLPLISKIFCNFIIAIILFYIYKSFATLFGKKQPSKFYKL